MNLPASDQSHVIGTVPNFVPDLPGQFTPSEYALPNQIFYRREHQYHPIDGELSGISGVTYDGEHHFMPFFDPAKADIEVLQTILARYDCLYPIDEHTALSMEQRGFTLDYHDSDSDYVFAAAQFNDYSGKALHAKRNLMRQFIDAATPHSVDLQGHADEACAVLKGWLADVGRSPEQSDYLQCIEALHAVGDYGMSGRLVLTSSGKAIGFVLVSCLGNDCAVVHFAKGRRAHNGVYPYMFSDFVRHNPDVRWLNFEQDLGNPKFRQNKRSFVPSHMIQKYRVRLRSN